MPEVRIEAEPRTEFGKGASRAIRREGRVPAVMYGHGAENRHFTLPEHELMLALKTPNALIRVEGLPGRAALALPKVLDDPLAAAVDMVNFAVDAGGADNITAVLIPYHAPETP